MKFIEKYLRKSRERKIKDHALRLAELTEMDFKEGSKVNHIMIWFDYSHYSKRTVEIEYADKRISVQTNHKNNNYQPK